jgi:hypothetical protein
VVEVDDPSYHCSHWDCLEQQKWWQFVMQQHLRFVVMDKKHAHLEWCEVLVDKSHHSVENCMF